MNRKILYKNCLNQVLNFKKKSEMNLFASPLCFRKFSNTFEMSKKISF